MKSNFSRKKFCLLIFAGLFLLLFFSKNVQAQTLQNGDLVRTKDSPALYLIQNGQKKIFPHLAVYLSWGLPTDFSTVKTVDDLSAYPEGEPVSFRDGSLFRGKTTSLYGHEASAVFFVSNGKLRPIGSSEIYQKLFNDPKWEKVKWIPDDLLSKFAYPMGELIEAAEIHPDGLLIRHKGMSDIYLIENGKERLITLSAITSNRLNLEDVVEIEPDEIYETGPEIQTKEESLTMNIPNVYKASTFIKHYRIKDWSEARGILQTKDGGYIFTGQSVYDKYGVLSSEDAFISKIDAKGNHQWTKLFQTFHSVGIDKGLEGNVKKGEEIGEDVIELKDGSFLMASQGTGFVDAEYLKHKEKWDDIFLTKFDKNGNHLWTKMIGDYSADNVHKLYATEDNGFLFSGHFSQTGFGKKDAPSDFVLIKFDKNGKKEWAKRIEMDYGDIEPLPDGAFIALGRIKTAGRESGSAEKFEDSAIPAVIKFNSNFGIEWAKSLEIIPMEESVYNTDEEGHTHMTYRTKRNSAGKFIAIRPMSNGYLALGILSPIFSGHSSWYTSTDKFSLVAVKINNSGELEWAKAIKLNMELDANIREAKIIKTKDNGFVFKMDYLPPPRSDQENKAEIVDEKKEQLDNLCQSKNRVEDCENGKITDDPEILLAWENYIKTVKSFENNLNNGLVLVKTDADFNPQWSKKISLEDYVYGYGVQPTSDNGLIIAGSYNTSILNYSWRMGQGYFQDTLLIKLDANGQVANNQGMISDYTDLSVRDVGPYLALKDFPPVVKSLSLKIDKKVQPKTPSLKTKVIDLCATAVNLVELISSTSLPKISLSQIPPKTKTWAEINYENAENTEEIKPIYAVASQIHQELLPILNELFVGEVKLKKDVSGGLDYIFGRLVTENDKTAVQNYLEGLGYKTYLAEGDQLVMMKIGRTLTITFSLKDKTQGTLFVSF